MYAFARSGLRTLAFAAIPALAATGALLWGMTEGDAIAADATPSAVTAMNALVGAKPQRCVFAGPDLEVCSWRIEGRLFEGDGVGTAEPERLVTLVCEVALSGDGEPKCRSHAGPTTADIALPPVGAGEPVPAAPGRPLLERGELADALTLVEISHLAGDTPQRCITGLGQQTCLWQLRPGTGGHERITAGQRGPVWLRCQLPLDGSGRKPGSCSASSLVARGGAS